MLVFSTIGLAKSVKEYEKEILEKRLADKSKNLNQLALFNNKEVK